LSGATLRPTFGLAFHGDECEYLTGNLAAAEERLAMLSRRAAGLVDRASVTCLRVVLYTTMDRPDRSVEICLEYLRDAGIEVSPHPTAEEVQQEYERMWQQIGGRPIEALFDLPLMSEPDRRATMDVLTEVMPPALYTDENLLGLVLVRMANLSMEYGNSDGSCCAYVFLNMVLGSRFGDDRAGFRFGHLSLDLVEKRGLDRFKARVYLCFGNLVIPWTQHLRAGRALIRRAFDAALEAGDLSCAAYSCNNMLTNLLASGDPLSDVQREAENRLGFAQKARFGIVVDIVTG
jgi:predicted ATPase